jgi:NADH-quinone oxidoreductase subunit G
VVKPLGETRPAWKVLRVLGNLLGLEGFEHESSDEVRAEALGDPASVAARLSNRPAEGSGAAPPAAAAHGGLERIADVPIYATDSIVRRAVSLQLTADARPPVAHLPADLWHHLGVRPGDLVRVSQGEAHVTLPAALDPTLDPGTVRVPVGHPDTAALGPMFGALEVAAAGPAAGTRTAEATAA